MHHFLLIIFDASLCFVSTTHPNLAAYYLYFYLLVYFCLHIRMRAGCCSESCALYNPWSMASPHAVYVDDWMSEPGTHSVHCGTTCGSQTQLGEGNMVQVETTIEVKSGSEILGFFVSPIFLFLLPEKMTTKLTNQFPPPPDQPKPDPILMSVMGAKFYTCPTKSPSQVWWSSQYEINSY